MVLTMKLQHVDELSGGRKRFRRRYPKAVAEALGEDFVQVPMQAREGAALVAEQEKLVREFDKIVAKAKGEAPEVTPWDHWRETLQKLRPWSRPSKEHCLTMNVGTSWLMISKAVGMTPC